MPRASRLFFAFALLAPVVFVGCQDDYSYFPIEDIYSRRILDHVLAGPESVPGANVWLQPTPGLAIDEEKRDAGGLANGYAGVYLGTDSTGRFSLLDGPIVYDLSLRQGTSVGIFRHVDRRAWEIPFLPDAPPTGFSSILNASTVPPPAAGHSVAYFLAAGTDSKSLANGYGDAGPPGTLVATYNAYTSNVTLFAVEYETAVGLTKPTSKGTLDLTLTNGVTASPVVTMAPIPDSDTFRDSPANKLPRVLTFAVQAPPADGFAFSDVEIWFSAGIRRDARPIAHVRYGDELPFAVAVGGAYWARSIASRADGATLDSGLYFFNAYFPTDPTTFATVPAQLPVAPPLGTSTFDGMHSFEVTFPPIPTTALGEGRLGIVEHTLVPKTAGGTTLRILTPEAAATIDDVTRLGAAQPAGTYTWTASYYPTFPTLVAFAGQDIRYIVPLSTTAPQTIVLK